MKTELEDAFTDIAPMGLMPFSTKAMMLVNRALRYASLEPEDADFIGAYLCVSKGRLRPSEAEIMEAYLSLDEEQLNAIMEYMVRVRTRQSEAAIEVADSSVGKSVD